MHRKSHYKSVKFSFWVSVLTVLVFNIGIKEEGDIDVIKLLKHLIKSFINTCYNVY